MSRGQSVERGAVPTEALIAGTGEGGLERRGTARAGGREGGEEAPGAGLAVLPDTHPPLLPFTRTDNGRDPACAIPPLPPLYRSGN